MKIQLKIQQCLQLGAAAFFSINVLTVHAQTTRVTNMESGTAITSLTSLHKPVHASPSFGAIDGSVNGVVSLDVWVATDLTSAEFSNQTQSGKASGSSRLRTSILTQSGVPNGLPSTNPGSVSGPLGSLKAPAVQTSSFQSLPVPLSPALLKGSSPSLQAPSSQSAQAPSPGDLTQTGSFSASQPTSGGSQTPGVSRTRHRGIKDLGHRMPPASRSDSADSSDDTAASDVDTASDESGSTSAGGSDASSRDQEAPLRFFEFVRDPFADSLKDPFKGSKRKLGFERTCGDACYSEEGGTSDDLASGENESGNSNAQDDRANSLQPGRKLYSRLEDTLGRLSDEAPGSENVTQRRSRSMNRLGRAALNEPGRRKSAGSGESSK